MTDSMTSFAKRNVLILIIAQAVLGAQMPLLFTFSGLAGQKLASNICFATLPISMIVFGSMTTAPWLSQFMQRFGRTAGFLLGATGGAAGALICAYAIYVSSFAWLLAGSYLTGIYMSAHGFYRFAATDLASDDYRPKAISYVMAAGLLSAVIGPQLGAASFEAMAIPFLGVYAAAFALNCVGFLIFPFLKSSPVTVDKDQPYGGRSRMELLKNPRIATAIICAMVSYALMNLVMTSTPLAVVGCGFTEGDAGNIVTAHVFAMFAPSFFTGHLIARFGVEKIMGTGLFILMCAGLVALAGVQLSNFFIALALLGIGWNFGFIGATAMLATSHTPEERGKAQGMNDFLVFGMVTVASLASGGLMNCSGGSVIQGWNAVNLAMIPFLMLAFGALVWLAMFKRKEA
ncbi:MFS transporter [Neptunicoccus cionae]|uniref:MFS transporter n=1 Tax=Neptunicoccus cionae TaxID=2035344 RepID=UPI000C791AE4|nr:MFS transporter [Amylibacter cionae]PLS22238.1 MFS transporter [Amylibacter cionae]